MSDSDQSPTGISLSEINSPDYGLTPSAQKIVREYLKTHPEISLSEAVQWYRYKRDRNNRSSSASRRRKREQHIEVRAEIGRLRAQCQDRLYKGMAKKEIPQFLFEMIEDLDHLVEMVVEP